MFSVFFRSKRHCIICKRFIIVLNIQTNGKHLLLLYKYPLRSLLRFQRFVNTLDVRTEDAVTWREIYVRGAVAYDIIISLPLGAFYTNLSLSVTDLSNIQLPGAHICRARVSHIGRNLPCAQSQRDLINENSIFYSKM